MVVHKSEIAIMVWTSDPKEHTNVATNSKFVVLWLYSLAADVVKPRHASILVEHAAKSPGRTQHIMNW